jgi:sulfofructose kinase
MWWLLPAPPPPRQFIPALAVPDDILLGAQVYSFLANPSGMWEDHCRFARAASAHAIQYLGNEASLPTLAPIK